MSDQNFVGTPEQRLAWVRARLEIKQRRREERAFFRKHSAIEREERVVEAEKQAHQEAGRFSKDQKLAWIYARASHVENSDTDSIPAQIDRCKRRFHASWEERGYMLANIEPDRITSASKINFFDRTNGGLIGRLAMPGDVILVDKMTRIFRSLADFVMTQKDLDNRGILLEIGDCCFCSDPNNPFYRAMIVMMAMFAEMESAQTSMRIKQAFDRRREAGADTNSRVPYGVITVRMVKEGYGEKPLKFRQWQTWERSVMNTVCIKADKEGWSCKEVTDWLNLVVLKDCKIPHKSPNLSYPLTEWMVLSMYWWEKMFRIYGAKDVKQTRGMKSQQGDWPNGKLPFKWEKIQKVGWLPLPE
jgi:DNA invertase Pin-like site-specific DNA recombinase